MSVIKMKEFATPGHKNHIKMMGATSGKLPRRVTTTKNMVSIFDNTPIDMMPSVMGPRHSV